MIYAVCKTVEELVGERTISQMQPGLVRTVGITPTVPDDLSAVSDFGHEIPNDTEDLKRHGENRNGKT